MPAPIEDNGLDSADDLEAFTIQEVADRLRVHPKTVGLWIADGELQAVRRGDRFIRVRPSQLRAFLDASV